MAMMAMGGSNVWANDVLSTSAATTITLSTDAAYDSGKGYIDGRTNGNTITYTLDNASGDTKYRIDFKAASNPNDNIQDASVSLTFTIKNGEDVATSKEVTIKDNNSWDQWVDYKFF